MMAFGLFFLLLFVASRTADVPILSRSIVPPAAGTNDCVSDYELVLECGKPGMTPEGFEKKLLRRRTEWSGVGIRRYHLVIFDIPGGFSEAMTVTGIPASTVLSPLILAGEPVFLSALPNPIRSVCA